MSPRMSFFSPKGKLTVSRPVATVMNSLNMLAPVLLLIALILAATSKFGSHSLPEKKLLIQFAGWAIALALAVRIVWGIGIRILRHRS